MTMMYQCRLRKGTQEMTAWIEARGAIVGKNVEIIEDNKARWNVVKVFRPGMEESVLKDKQSRDRDSLPSIRGK